MICPVQKEVVTILKLISWTVLHRVACTSNNSAPAIQSWQLVCWSCWTWQVCSSCGHVSWSESLIGREKGNIKYIFCWILLEKKWLPNPVYVKQAPSRETRFRSGNSHSSSFTLMMHPSKILRRIADRISPTENDKSLFRAGSWRLICRFESCVL